MTDTPDPDHRKSSYARIVRIFGARESGLGSTVEKELIEGINMGDTQAKSLSTEGLKRLCKT